MALFRTITRVLFVLHLFLHLTQSIPYDWVTVDTTGLPTERHEACFVMVGDKGYLVGGRGIRPIDVYDPSDQSWTEKTGPGIEIHHTQCVAYDDKIWIVSAWTGSPPFEDNVPDIWIYDTLSDSWSTKDGLPEPRQRGSAAAVLHEGEIYLSHGNRGGHGPHSEAFGWFDKYNITNDVWITDLPDAPNPRDHTGGAIVNGELCVAAGRDSGIDGGDAGELAFISGLIFSEVQIFDELADLAIVPMFFAVVRETDCYNFDTGTWSVRAKIPQGRAGSAYGRTCDGKMMVAGGEGFGFAFSNVDIFDGFQWTEAPPLNNGRHGTGLAVDCACDQIHIASGSTNIGSGGDTTLTETYFSSGSTCPKPDPILGFSNELDFSEP